jgi:hypothetical protein
LWSPRPFSGAFFRVVGPNDLGWRAAAGRELPFLGPYMALMTRRSTAASESSIAVIGEESGLILNLELLDYSVKVIKMASSKFYDRVKLAKCDERK